MELIANKVKLTYFEYILMAYLLLQLPIKGINITLANIASILIFIYFIIKIKYININFYYKFDLINYAFLIVITIGFIKLMKYSFIRSDFIRFVYLIIMSYIIRWILEYRVKLNNWDIVDYLAKLISIMGLLNSTMIILQYTFPDVFVSANSFYYEGNISIRPSGFIEPNFSNLLISLSLMANIYYIRTNNNKIKNIIYMFVLVIASVITISRTGMIINSILLTFCFLRYLYNNKPYKKFMAISIVAIITQCIFIYVANNFYLLINKNDFFRMIYLRFSEMGGLEGSAGTRSSLIKLGINLFRENPIFGNGFFSTRVYDDLGQVAHNTFIQVIADFGIIGLALLMIILIISFLTINRLNNSYKRSFLYLVYIVIIYYMMLLTLIDKTVLLIFLAIIPILSIENSTKRSKI